MRQYFYLLSSGTGSLRGGGNWQPGSRLRNLWRSNGYPTDSRVRQAVLWPTTSMLFGKKMGNICTTVNKERDTKKMVMLPAHVWDKLSFDHRPVFSLFGQQRASDKIQICTYSDVDAMKQKLCSNCIAGSRVRPTVLWPTTSVLKSWGWHSRADWTVLASLSLWKWYEKCNLSSKSINSDVDSPYQETKAMLKSWGWSLHTEIGLCHSNVLPIWLLKVIENYWDQWLPNQQPEFSNHEAPDQVQTRGENCVLKPMWKRSVY